MAAAVLIVLFAGWLRTVAAADTQLDHPFRADAIQYYKTAYNLRAHGVYSHVVNEVNGVDETPQPDAFLTPGYPLFLALFVDAPPNTQAYSEITGYQALLAILAVILVLLLFRTFSPWIALPAALLAAISPHLISAATFILSETLFSVVLLLSLLVLGWHARGSRWYLPSLFAGGVLLGVAALTRPVVELFPMAVVFLLWVSYDRRTALRGSAVLILGVCLAWAPWIARNYVSLGRSGDPANMVRTLSIGMYPDLEYDHDPRSNGEPDKLDPRYTEISTSPGAALDEIGRRFRDNPREELRWYLIGKPVMLWSWHDVGGGPDVFIYPVFRSPYTSSKPFILTHSVMYGLHWPLVILALVGCLLAWLPRARSWLAREPLFLARLMSLLLLYNTVVLMVLAPFVRYSIPFLPIQYGMAATALYLVARWWRQRGGGAPAQ
ncbi:MAG TPA: hypothetical protein VGT99_12250 [Gammaproteobacteria bacterium]|nr:hypothetical protein [Gammaproteobacteria bacterium]